MATPTTTIGPTDAQRRSGSVGRAAARAFAILGAGALGMGVYGLAVARPVAAWPASDVVAMVTTVVLMALASFATTLAGARTES